MIWQYKDCPLCGKEMRAVHGDPKEPMYLLRCPTPMDVPFEYGFRMEIGFKADQISSHFELEFSNHKPHFQSLRLYPFCLSGYDDVYNIYRYDERLFLRFVAEIQAFEIPWNDQQKIIKKLSTYTLFS